MLVTALFVCLCVYGSDAGIEVINYTPPETQGPAALTLRHSDDRRVRREFQRTDTVGENLELFARSIDGKAKYIFTGTQKIANIAALEAICCSAVQNRPMAVAPLTCASCRLMRLWPLRLTVGLCDQEAGSTDPSRQAIANRQRC